MGEIVAVRRAADEEAPPFAVSFEDVGRSAAQVNAGVVPAASRADDGGRHPLSSCSIEQIPQHAGAGASAAVPSSSLQDAGANRVLVEAPELPCEIRSRRAP